MPAALFAAPTPDVAAIDRGRVLPAAQRYVREKPITVTASSSPRSAGGRHDFFSEGDYWWPDPVNPAAPYIQRDGMTNPGNFVKHRQALMRLSVQVPALTAAFLITKQQKYADHAALHLRAWFLDEGTRMNPTCSTRRPSRAGLPAAASGSSIRCTWWKSRGRPAF